MTCALHCAFQVTALGQPKLLERVSDSLVSVHNLFRRFDEDLNGVVTRDEFEKVLGRWLTVVKLKIFCCLLRRCTSKHACVSDTVIASVTSPAAPRQRLVLFFC